MLAKQEVTKQIQNQFMDQVKQIKSKYDHAVVDKAKKMESEASIVNDNLKHAETIQVKSLQQKYFAIVLN